MVEVVLLLKFSDIFNQNSEVVRVIFVLSSTKSRPVCFPRFVIYANVEKHRNDVEFQILKLMVSSKQIRPKMYFEPSRFLRVVNFKIMICVHETPYLYILQRQRLCCPLRQWDHNLQIRPRPAHEGHHRGLVTIAGPLLLSLTLLKLDQSKLDGSEVLDGHDHVIEDGDVLPVHGEQPLKVDQGPDLGEDREEDGVRGV